MSNENTTAYPAGRNIVYLAPCGVQSGAIKCGCNDEGECHIIKMLEEQTAEDDAEIARFKAALVAAADAMDRAFDDSDLAYWPLSRKILEDGADAARKAAE